MQLLCCITIIAVTLYDTTKTLLLSAFIKSAKRRSQAACNCAWAYTMVSLIFHQSNGNLAKLHCAFCHLTPVIAPVGGIANNDRNVLWNDTITENLGHAVWSDLCCLIQSFELPYGTWTRAIGHRTSSSCYFSCNVHYVSSSRGRDAHHHICFQMGWIEEHWPWPYHPRSLISNH